MLPWLGVAIAGGYGLKVIIDKVMDYFKSKNQKEIEVAKKEIINGIKEYDAEQETGENESPDNEC